MADARVRPTPAARLAVGDRKSLDDYANWVRQFTPDQWELYTDFPFFWPLYEHPDHPAVAAAAEWLFNDSRSPWVPLVGKSNHGVGRRLSDLLESPLLGARSFRKAVLKELANEQGDGTIEIDKFGSASLHLDEVIDSSGGGSSYRELDIPESGIKGKFRICDYIAWVIGEKHKGHRDANCTGRRLRGTRRWRPASLS